MTTKMIALAGGAQGTPSYTDGVMLAVDFLNEIKAATLNDDPVRDFLAQWLDGLHGEERTGFLDALSEYIGAAASGCVLSPNSLRRELLEGDQS